MIGETGVFLACLEELINSKISVRFVVTQEHTARSLAGEHGIECFSSMDAAQDSLSQGVDYLFSIANPRILSDHELSFVNSLAINYHDSPLPKYAGSHATSWAILNGEKDHGISWHVIEGKVDSGDIIKQKFFSIDPRETASSLNIKCLRYSTEAFVELLQEIEGERVKRVKQKLEDRSFYSKKRCPHNGGVIHWGTSAKDIDRLVRALYWGRQENTFALPRLIIGEETYYLTGSEYEPAPKKGCSKAGEIISLNKDSLRVSTRSGVIIIKELLDTSGEVVDMHCLAAHHQLSVGDLLPNYDLSFLTRCYDQCQLSKNDENYWIEVMKGIVPIGVPWLVDSTESTEQVIKRSIGIPMSCLHRKGSSFQPRIQMIALFLANLHSFTCQQKISVGFKHSSLNCSHMWSDKILNLSLPPRLTLSQLAMQVEEKIKETISKAPPSSDLELRYRKEVDRLPVEILVLEKESDFLLDADVFLQIRVFQDRLEIHARCGEANRKYLETFLSTYSSLLNDLRSLTESKLSELPIVCAGEKVLLDSFNIPAQNLSVNVCIHKLFESQVDRTPDAIAVSFIGSYLTYRELNRRSSSLATHLQKLIKFSSSKQAIVGILSDRSIEMVISMIGCLKAGVAYLPIDSNYPRERVKHIFSDANTKVVITRKHLLKNLEKNVVPILMEDIVNFSETRAILDFSPHLMTYVLYTSGSTGLPRGAGLTHYSVANLLVWYSREFQITDSDNILIFTAFGFDLTQKNILGGLISGSTICLFPNINFDPYAIIELIEREYVTFLNCPPSAFYSIAEYSEEKQKIPSLRICLLGGEAIQPGKIRSFYNTHNCKIINTYGPTECSDLALTHDIKQSDLEDGATIPLGRNVGNVSIYILNSNLFRVPVGCIGEVYLSGVSLGVGYLGKPELTAQTFIANPFEKGARLYKTSDYGRYLPDGKVEFCGRIDHQVKVRGFRIELQEIEYVISELEVVSQCISILREDVADQKKLVSYIIPSSKHNLEKKELAQRVRNQCAKMLPAFMCPAQIVVLSEFPLTANGKIDRKMLPEPGKKEWANSYEEPVGEYERILAELWGELLGVERVGRNDNFFNLGGDSILAVRFLANLRDAGFNLDLNDLYLNKCISKLPQKGKRNAQKVEYTPFSLLGERQLQQLSDRDMTLLDAYPASFMQKGMLLESAKDPSVYHDIFSYTIHQPFDLILFSSVLANLIKKHPTLRTSIREDEQYSFIVLEHSSIDLDEKVSVEPPSNLKRRVLSELERPIDLQSPGLFRVIVLNSAGEKFDLIFSFFHIIMDGWSLNLLVSEFLSAYETKHPLLNLLKPLCFGEYVQSEIDATSNGNFVSYYRTLLKDFSFPTTLSMKKNLENERIPYEISGIIGRETSRMILEIAKKKGITPDIVFIAAYIFSLGRVGGKKDILIGTIINNRLPIQGGDRQLGLFLNTKLLRAKLPSGNAVTSPDNFLEFVSQLLTDSLFSNPFPYQSILTELSLEKDILSFCFNYVHFARNLEYQEKGLLSFGPFYERTDIPCTFNVVKMKDSFKLSLNINRAGIPKSVSQSVFDYIQLFLKALIEPTAPTPLLTEKDQVILGEVNAPVKKNRRDGVVHYLFEDQLAKRPDSIALVCGEVSLSYAELNHRAEVVATTLIEKYKVTPEECVAVCMERSEKVVIAILGILKAGACYTPIPSIVPKGRLEYILKDNLARVVMIDAVTQKRFNRFQLEGISLFFPKYQRNETKMTKRDVFSQQLAYVIYTSGSSGDPKGVAVSHQSVTNYLINLQEEEVITGESIVDFSSQIAFDLSVTTTLGALCAGARIEIYPGKLEDSEAFRSHVIRKKVEVMKQVTSYFSPLLLFLHETSVQTLILGGEKLDRSLLENLSLTDIKIYDEYGPTETTVGACICQVYPLMGQGIGRPYRNYQVYILNEYLEQLPVGSIGELCIGGMGLSRGYFGKADQTAAKFIANPFPKGSRLYKTGDFARWCPDGTLEYIGREDNQVKLRSYRVELGEIESQLKRLDFVEDAVVVIVRTQDRDYGILYCYYTANSEVAEEQLKELLKHTLPEYMIPSKFVHVEDFPRTVNGKVDRSSFPRLTDISKGNFVAPKTEQEKELCRIWKEILGVKQVGVREDFFRLGGDSVASILLVNRIRQRLGLNVTIKDIFELRTIEMIIGRVRTPRAQNAIKAEQGLLTGEVELLPIQEWFFEQNFENPCYWNQSFLICVPELEIPRLRNALKKLYYHHDSFRLRYQGKKQYYTIDDSLPELKIGHCSDELQKILRDWQSHFDLEKGPLHAFGYISGYEDGRARVFIAAHHLIIDAVSWRILAQDLQKLYEGEELEAKGSSYRQWVKEIKKYPSRYEEKEYWEGLKIQKLDLPFVDGVSSSAIELDKVTTEKLLTEVHALYKTEINDILLSALVLGVKEVFGFEEISIALESHGREPFDPNLDVSQTLGWFTSFYPVCLKCHGDTGEIIKETKETLRSIPNKGIGYGAQYGYHNLPQIYMNYLGKIGGNIRDEWTISGEECGSSLERGKGSDLKVGFEGMVKNGKLQFKVIGCLDAVYVHKLASSFEKNLVKLIEHSIRKERGYLTPSDIGNIVDKSYLDSIQECREIESIYLANSLQQGLIYHFMNQGEFDDAYHVQLVWDYNTKIDISKMKQAWEFALRSFSALRLRFEWSDELVQIIDKKGELDWRFIDLSTKDNESELIVKNIQEEDRKESYDLINGKLWRIYLIKRGKGVFSSILSNHHSILDGWSRPILLSFVHQIYLDFLRGKGGKMPQDPYPKVQEYIQEHRSDFEAYWKGALSQVDGRPDLTSLQINQLQKTSDFRFLKEPKRKKLLISDLKLDRLKSFCEKQGFTMNAIIQFVWHRALHVFGSCSVTVSGLTISGRNIPIDGIECGVGLFINTLPLIFEHRNREPVISAIKRMQNTIQEINDRGTTNLSDLRVNEERLFDSIVIYENYPTPEKVNQLHITEKYAAEKLDYPLSVIIQESPEKLDISLEYAGEFISKEGVARLLCFMEYQLSQLNKDQLLAGELQSVEDLEDNQKWNLTEKPFPRDKLLHTQFAEQAKKSPDAIAIRYFDRYLSYSELNDLSDAVALALQSYGVIPEDRVALFLERSESLVIVILGILKSGAVYVPIDRAAPKPRVEYMLKSTSAKLLISDNQESDFSVDRLGISSLLERGKYLGRLDVSLSSQSLAYLIFTSGSTGSPKGVMIPHEAAMNRIHWMNSQFPIDMGDGVLQKTPYFFDVSVWEFFWPILHGGTLVILPPHAHTDPAKVVSTIKKQCISHIHFVPSMLGPFIDVLRNTGIDTLKYLFCSGEALTLEQVSRIRELLPITKIVNLYGPTETTVDSTCYEIGESEEILIGFPIDNTKIYVLDQQLNEVPVGVVGEIYISGVGLARGYVGQPKLTADKFLANPFESGKRFYRTGDLVRRMADGNLEFVGRNDHQVKIHGQRVELAEIEEQLLRIEGVDQSLVMLRDHPRTNEKVLVGYLVVNSGYQENLLTEALSDKLPQYMVPKYFIEMEAFPHTSNGKIDRSMFPDPSDHFGAEYSLPKSELEQQVLEVWKELFDQDEISTKAEFWKLGGSSILAIKMVNLLKKRLGTYFLRPNDLLLASSIEKLADLINSQSASVAVEEGEI